MRGTWFTQQLFVAMIADGEKHCILNDEYLRRSLVSEEVLEKRKVVILDALLDLVHNTFGVEIENDDRIGLVVICDVVVVSGP